MDFGLSLLWSADSKHFLQLTHHTPPPHIMFFFAHLNQIFIYILVCIMYLQNSSLGYSQIYFCVLDTIY